MLNFAHRWSALFIGCFIVVHLINHGMIFLGVDAHIQFMDKFRMVYRNVVIESLLLIMMLFQISSGLFFVWRARGNNSASLMRKLQVYSGLYLAFFMLNHVGAVLFGRWVLALDTNIYFALAGVYVPGFQWFFIPYYFLAVVAVFIHIAMAAYWLSSRLFSTPNRLKLSCFIMGTGFLYSTLLMSFFIGLDITIPEPYLMFYQF